LQSSTATRKLLNCYWAHSSVTAEDGANCTALHLAARSGSVAVVNLLLDAKSDRTRSNGEQKTALHIASEYGHGEIVSLLLAANAVDVCVRDRWKQTPLHLAVQGVMKMGDDGPFLPSNEELIAGRQEAVRLLLAAGASVDDLNILGETPFHCVMRRGWSQIASILLDAKADVEARNRQGFTALHVASNYGSYAAVRLLLNAHADVNAVDNHGKTPLYYAAVPPHSFREITLALLDAGAKFSWHDQLGTAIKDSVYRDSRRQITTVIKEWQGKNKKKVQNTMPATKLSNFPHAVGGSEDCGVHVLSSLRNGTTLKVLSWMGIVVLALLVLQGMMVLVVAQLTVVQMMAHQLAIDPTPFPGVYL